MVTNKFSVKELKNKDVDDIRSKYEEASKNISYEYFEQYADKFVQGEQKQIRIHCKRSSGLH